MYTHGIVVHKKLCFRASRRTPTVPIFPHTHTHCYIQPLCKGACAGLVRFNHMTPTHTPPPHTHTHIHIGFNDMVQLAIKSFGKKNLQVAIQLSSNGDNDDQWSVFCLCLCVCMCLCMFSGMLFCVCMLYE